MVAQVARQPGAGGLGLAEHPGRPLELVAVDRPDRVGAGADQRPGLDEGALPGGVLGVELLSGRHLDGF